jgi:hypothetical protein
MPNKKGRKLFFTGAEVRRFVTTYPGFTPPFFPDSRERRSEKIALNPHFLRGDAITIERAKSRLGLSSRGVQYYLKRGDLKDIRCGHRTILITLKSVEHLYRSRLSEAERRYVIAEKRLQKVRGW